MNSVAALPNGAFSANHCGSVWPCGLTIGKSFTVAYSARESARWVGSETSSRSGWSSSFMAFTLIVSHGFRHATRCAVAEQLGQPVGDERREPRVGGQILAENRAQAQQFPGKRRRVSTMSGRNARELGRHGIRYLDRA